MDCLNLFDWNYPDTMLGIPINPTTPSFSTLLYRSLSLPPSLFPAHGLSLHVYPISFLYPNPRTSSSKFAATIFHSECGGAGVGGLPFSWLSCARSRIVTPCLRVLILIAYLTIRVLISWICEGHRIVRSSSWICICSDVIFNICVYACIVRYKK